MNKVTVFGIVAVTMLTWTTTASTSNDQKPMCKNQVNDAQAQSCRNQEKMHNGIHYLLIGGALVENGAVNKEIERLGYTGFSRYSLSLGFGGIRLHGRFVSGGEFEGLLWKHNKNGNSESMFSAGRLLSLHGISVLPSSNFLLYPLVGIGGGISSLRAGPKEVPFDSAFAIPSQLPSSSSLSQFTFLVDLGLGMNYSHPFPHGKPGKMSIGLRAGYMFDPFDNDEWHRHGTTLTNGPNSDLSGPYVRLTLGTSGVHKGKEGCCPHHKDSGKKCCDMPKEGK